MNSVFKTIILAKKIAVRLGMPQLNRGHSFENADYSFEEASSYIKNTLNKETPCMIARFGAAELSAMLNYIDKDNYKTASDLFKYITGTKAYLYWAGASDGYFPEDVKKVEQYMRLFLKDMLHVDILGSWMREELFFQKELSQAIKVRLPDLEPYYDKNPWSSVLKGKKVLVIHPFEESIISQYKKRKLLFKNEHTLPDFELLTIKSDYSLATTKTICTDMTDVYETIINQINVINFDIAIIGCGPYGFNLAAYIKRIGKKAIHLGGATQILFGIKGKRWDTHPLTAKLYNEHWIYPKANEIPQNYKRADDGCYWG